MWNLSLEILPLNHVYSGVELFGCLDAASSFSCCSPPIGQIVASLGAAAALVSGLLVMLRFLCMLFLHHYLLDSAYLLLSFELLSLELVLLALQEHPRLRGGESP